MVIARVNECNELYDYTFHATVYSTSRASNYLHQKQNPLLQCKIADAYSMHLHERISRHSIDIYIYVTYGVHLIISIINLIQVQSLDRCELSTLQASYIYVGYVPMLVEIRRAIHYCVPSLLQVELAGLVILLVGPQCMYLNVKA